MHIEEERSPFGLDGAGLARAECGSNRIAQVARHLLALDDHAIGGIRQIRNKDRRTAISAALVQFLQRKRIHTNFSSPGALQKP